MNIGKAESRRIYFLDSINDDCDHPRPGSGACREGPDVCAVLLTLTSILIIVITIPLSLLWSIKVVQVGLQPLVPSVYCDKRWSGVREGGHLPPGPAADGRSQGAWYMLTL